MWESMGNKKGAYRFWWGNPKERDHLQDLGVDGRILLKWILKNYRLSLCTGLICVIIYKKWRSGVAGFYEDGNEHSVYRKMRGLSSVHMFRTHTNPNDVTAVSTLISGFSRDLNEICALLGYYATLCGNCLPTLRPHLHGSAREDGTDSLSRNVCKRLPHDAA